MEDENLNHAQGDVLPPLYFPDGDIVIVCSTPGGSDHVNRVDKAILRRHSPVFAGMFTLPEQPSPETYDGVAMVRLPDEAQDVEAILRALYDPSTLIFKEWVTKDWNPDTPLIQMRLLRMAKKYEITWVTTLVKKNICAQWPTTFDEYEDMYSSRREEIFEAPVPEPALAIRMGVDFDIPSILPAAFLRLADIGPGFDWDKELGVEADGYDRYDMECCARWSLLHASELLRLWRGKEWLDRKFNNVKPHLDRSKAANLMCNKVNRTECSEQKKTFNRSATPLSSEHVSFDAIPAVFMRRQCIKIAALPLCDSCQCHEVDKVREWGAKIWDSLSEVFELS